MESADEETCVEVLDEATVQVTPPEASQGYRSGTTKATRYTFTGVFDERSTQQQLFRTTALPLVDDVLHGKNGLLFAYGVTGSGKTHTMNGEPGDGGVIPRCLDVIFNSVAGMQARSIIIPQNKPGTGPCSSAIPCRAGQEAHVQAGPNERLRHPERVGRADRAPAGAADPKRPQVQVSIARSSALAFQRRQKPHARCK